MCRAVLLLANICSSAAGHQHAVVQPAQAWLRVTHPAASAASTACTYASERRNTRATTGGLSWWGPSGCLLLLESQHMSRAPATAALHMQQVLRRQVTYTSNQARALLATVVTDCMLTPGQSRPCAPRAGQLRSVALVDPDPAAQ